MEGKSISLNLACAAVRTEYIFTSRKTNWSEFIYFISPESGTLAGADPRFQVKKKLRRAEGGAKIFGVFRVKNHDFAPKNHIFSNFRAGRVPGAPPPPGSTPV